MGTDLEQAADDYTEGYDYSSVITSTGIQTTKAVNESFIAGANWQLKELEDIHIDIIKFLDLIDSSTGEIITEYHWREALGLIKQLTDKI